MRLARRSSRSHPPGTCEPWPLTRLPHSQILRAFRPALADQSPPPSPADHHNDPPAPASRALQPLAPIENGGPFAITPGLLGGVGFDLVLGIPGTTRSAARPPPSVGGGPSSDLLLRYPARSLRRRSLANHTAPGHSTRPASCQTRVQAALYRSAQESRGLEPRVSSR
jgi:hypothetical protein